MTAIAAMKSIALPERKILLPRLEFPAWVRRIGDPLKMLAPLGGMLTPLGVSGVAAESLLLDTVTGAYGAYSLRKLRSAYSGSAVRVRRSSDNSEQDIGFSGTDFDATTFSSFIGAGSGYVTSWYDQSGNANDITQSTTGAQPLLVLSVQNGRPIVRGDGTNDVLKKATPTGRSVTPSSLFIVMARKNTSSNYVIDMNGSSANAVIMNWSANLAEYYGSSPRVSMGSIATGVFGLHGYKMDASGNITSYKNGVQISTGSGTPSAAHNLSVFASLSAYYANVDIAEIILLSVETSQRETIEASMNTYYAIY